MFETLSSGPEVLKHLKEGNAFAHQAIAGLGQLIAYARMNGVKPP